MAWKLHAIEQMQLRGRRRVDGVGRPKFDFHTGAAQADAAKLDEAWEAEKDSLQQAYKKAHKKAAARKRRRLGEK